MKRIAILTAGVAAAIGAGANARPAEAQRYKEAVRRVSDATAAYPLPAVLAVGGILLAATVRRRSAAPPPATESENPVIARAKARATWAQLLSDQMALKSKYESLPKAVATAEQKLAAAERSVGEARAVFEAREEARDEAADTLGALRKELAAGEAELAAIGVEMKKLSGLV